MPKNFEEKFRIYCNSENLEVNQNQLLVIKKLQDYYKKNFKSLIFNFFFAGLLCLLIVAFCFLPI